MDVVRAAVKVLMTAALAAIGIVAHGQLTSDGHLSWSSAYQVFGGAFLALAGAGYAILRLSRPLTLDEAEQVLARVVLAQWRSEATATVRIRWKVAGGEPESDMAALVRSFRALPAQRMLILGPSGSGKRILALRILLQLLADRTDDDPVPVFFDIRTWDPAVKPFHDWLATRLEDEYPFLAAAPGDSVARALIARRRILPILDGLDEAPRAQWGGMVGEIERALASSEPLIVTTWRRKVPWLAPLKVSHLAWSTADLASHLLDGLPPRRNAGWTTLSEWLSKDPRGPVTRALSNPWVLSLVRSVYDPQDDPSELTDAARFPSSGAIEQHVLNRLETLLAPQGRSPDGVRRWLSFLGDDLALDGFAWWRLPLKISPTVHNTLMAASVLTAGFLVAFRVNLAIGFDEQLLESFVLAGAICGPFAVFLGRRRAARWHPVQLGRRSVPSPRKTLRTALAVTAGQTAGGGLLIAAGMWSDFIPLTIGGGLCVLGAMFTPGFSYPIPLVVLAIQRRIPLRLMSFLENAHRAGLLQQVGAVYRFWYRDEPDVPAEEPVERETVAPETPPTPPTAEPAYPAQAMVPSIEPPVADIAPTTTIDRVAWLKICEEALAQPEVLLKIDDSLPGRSRDDVARLAERLLAANAGAVERVAADQRERYVSARRRLVEAAGLRIWSRPFRVYQAIFWLAGAVVVWTAAMWWPALTDPPVLLWVSSGAFLLALLAWSSSMPAQRIRTILASDDPAEWLRLPPILAGFRVAAEQAHHDWIRAMVREGLLPLLRSELGDEHDAMSTILPRLDPGRLGGLSRIDEFVGTEESRYLEHLVTTLGSASVGLSGSRGAGKSTVLRHLCARNDGEAHLRLLVHAPTAYDPREFITHLFVKLCETVTGDAGDRIPMRRRRGRLSRFLPATGVIVGAALLIGALQWDGLRTMMGEVAKQPTLIVGLIGALLIVAGVAGVWLSGRHKPQAMGSTASEVAARAHLRSLRYLQAVTHTQSGEVNLPGGVKLGGQAAVQRTEQAWSYPHLVAELRELLGQITLDRQRLQGKVIIGIDELDKIGTAEDAERFLNDLKVVFGVHGCFFLVALSEDALTGFERRSLGIRNTFDSAFDRIIRIPAMRCSESQALLSRRGVPLPTPYVWLCHALTGGLPRDLLRTTLDLITIASQHQERDLPSLAARLIRQDLRTVIGAQSRAAARLSGDQASAITGWLALCVTADPLSDTLDRVADRAPRGQEEEPTVVQTRAYLGILATLSRIFVERRLERMTPEIEADVIDRLAEARLLLATDPHLAWHSIRRVRGEVTFLALHVTDGRSDGAPVTGSTARPERLGPEPSAPV